MDSNDKTRPAMGDHIGYIATYEGPTFQSKIAKVEYLEQDDSSSDCSSSKGRGNSDEEDNLAIVVEGNESYGEHPQDRSVSPDREASEQKNEEEASVTDCGRGVDMWSGAPEFRFVAGFFHFSYPIIARFVVFYSSYLTSPTFSTRFASNATTRCKSLPRIEAAA